MKLIILLLTCYLSPLWAKDIKHSEFNFRISAHKFKSTDLHYSFISVNRDTFQKEAGPFSSLLLTRDERKPGKKYVLLRAVFPVKQAIGFFDTDKFNDVNFLQQLEDHQKFKRINDSTFITQVSSPIKHQYFSKFHFDADDLSSLPDSKIGRKIMELKSTDPLLLSANVSIFREMFGYTQYIDQSSEFFGLISLDETSTMVVFMKLIVYSSDDTLDYVIERDLINKTKRIQKAFEKN